MPGLTVKSDRVHPACAYLSFTVKSETAEILQILLKFSSKFKQNSSKTLAKAKAFQTKPDFRTFSTLASKRCWSLPRSCRKVHFFAEFLQMLSCFCRNDDFA